MRLQISVIIPAYNREKTIERCIKSVMGQTVKPLEIIVVDDGSKDRTVEILENMECNILRIIRQNHKGAQAARNIGILNAKGCYITFLDSDDEWLPKMLERGIGHLSKGKEGCVIYGDCYACKDNKKSVWNLPGHSGNMYSFMLLHQGPMFQCMFVKKELLLRIGLLDENVAAYQEWETSIRLAKEAEFIHIREPLFVYYLHNGKTISKDITKEIEGYAYIVRKHQKEIIRKHGWKGLGSHYKFLVDLCYKDKNMQIFIFMLKYLMVNVLYIVKKQTNKLENILKSKS